MKITKGKSVKACDCCETLVDTKSEAIMCIKNAIDILASDPEDQICKDSIANLSVVLLDLSASDKIEIDGVEFDDIDQEEVFEDVVNETTEEEIVDPV